MVDLFVVTEPPVSAALRADVQHLIGKGWEDLPWCQCGVLLLIAAEQDALALLLTQLVGNKAVCPVSTT